MALELVGTDGEGRVRKEMRLLRCGITTKVSGRILTGEGAPRHVENPETKMKNYLLPPLPLPGPFPLRE